MSTFEYNNDYCILGNVYYLLNSYGIFHNRYEFIDFLVGKEGFTIKKVGFTNETLWSLMAKRDYITDQTYDLIKENLSNADTFCPKLKKLLNCLSQENADLINKALVTITQKADTYKDRKHTFSYSVESRKRLLAYYDIKKNSYSLAYSIYNLLYLAVYKNVPPNFYYGMKYEDDLEEFNLEVTKRYGVNSPNGARAILRLAEKNNLIALYEYADILYYGKTPSGIPDYTNCFEYLLRSAGLNFMYDVNRDSCNPLALWCLAYMHYNYHYRLDLKDIPPIPSLARMSFEDRVKAAIHLCKHSFELNKNVCAANLLGVIAYNEGEECRYKYSLQAPEEYFQYAADNGYVFAYNNLSNIYLDKIFNDPKHAEKHLISYLDNLNHGAEYYNNWSANQLGLFYLTGDVKSKHDSNSVTHFPAYIDRERAKGYFKRACECEHDAATAWALANLMIYFKEEYNNYSNVNLMTEHISTIIRLGNKGALEFLRDHLGNKQAMIDECEAMIV